MTRSPDSPRIASLYTWVSAMAQLLLVASIVYAAGELRDLRVDVTTLKTESGLTMGTVEKMADAYGKMAEKVAVLDERTKDMK